MEKPLSKPSRSKVGSKGSRGGAAVTRLPGQIYDYPKYYDLIFGSDCQAEMHFLQDCFTLFADRPVHSICEPACGTGRLMIRFAKLGYQVSGVDLNAKAVDFCNRRLQRNGFPASALVGDMCDFRLKRPADAAFNTINSFRHLESERLAGQHLRVMADAVAPGGLYVLGLHLTPRVGKAIEEEEWSATRGSLTIQSRMWLVARHPRRRLETYRMSYQIQKPSGRELLEDQFNFLTYDVDQILQLIADEPRWEIAQVYDFAYDVQQPIELNERSEDVVFVLRRVRGGKGRTRS